MRSAGGRTLLPNIFVNQRDNMQVKKLSGRLVFIPKSRIEILSLWFLSQFIGGYEKTYNEEAYPVGRRLKIDFKGL